jgi:hypothetical protein
VLKAFVNFTDFGSSFFFQHMDLPVLYRSAHKPLAFYIFDLPIEPVIDSPDAAVSFHRGIFVGIIPTVVFPGTVIPLPHTSIVAFTGMGLITVIASAGLCRNGSSENHCKEEYDCFFHNVQNLNCYEAEKANQARRLVKDC